MAVDKNLVVYTCDGCGKTELVRPPEPYPGFTVQVSDGCGGGLNYRYHACSDDCMESARKAMHKVTQDGLR